MSLYKNWGSQAGAQAPGEQFAPVPVPRVNVSTAAALDILMPADMQTFLKIDGEQENDLLLALIRTATIWAENYTGRSFIKRTYTMWLDRFPPGSIIQLPFPPAILIESFKWYDSEDVESDWDTANYILDLAGSPARIIMKPLVTIPTDPRIANAVKIVYTAGYGVAASDVPQAIKDAVRFIVSQWYEGRGVQQDAANFEIEKNIPQAAMIMLSPYKVVDFNENSQSQNQGDYPQGIL